MIIKTERLCKALNFALRSLNNKALSNEEQEELYFEWGLEIEQLLSNYEDKDLHTGRLKIKKA